MTPIRNNESDFVRRPSAIHKTWTALSSYQASYTSRL